MRNMTPMYLAPTLIKHILIRAVLLCWCQFGPDGDVKLFRSAPGSISIEAKQTFVEGHLDAQAVTVGSVPIEQYVQQIVEEMLKKKTDG